MVCLTDTDRQLPDCLWRSVSGEASESMAFWIYGRLEWYREHAMICERLVSWLVQLCL